MTPLVNLLQILNSLSPLGVIALLAVVILLMTHRNGPIKKLANNHLEHVQTSLDAIAKNSERTVELLSECKAELAWLRGKLDR
jgi:F0F1-type ATP synthase membrane subunit b/b'